MAAPCAVCGAPVKRKGARFCNPGCQRWNQKERGYQRTIRRLEDLVADLRRRNATPGSLVCLGCGTDRISDRWCSKECRDDWFEAVQRGETWVVSSLAGIFRLEDRKVDD